MRRHILVTGAAGFIGSHLVDRLLATGDKVTAIDNLNSFYDPTLKRENIHAHLANKNYKLLEGDIRDPIAVAQAFAFGPFDAVVHLAAMAGVRPSLENPGLYMDVNINGTQRLLDCVCKEPETRFVFGSSSSVYGKRSTEEFLETDRVDQPLSPYAASKASAEMACYAAHHSYNLPVVALRFFTVYGPRQRPDLAIHKFCKRIAAGEPIDVYGDGSSKRDYTFINDIIDGIESAISYDCSGFNIINLGRSEPVILLDMIKTIEKYLKKTAKLNFKDPQLGDVPFTFANIEKARKLLGYKPSTSLDQGIRAFAEWYLNQPLRLKA